MQQCKLLCTAKGLTVQTHRSIESRGRRSQQVPAASQPHSPGAVASEASTALSAQYGVKAARALSFRGSLSPPLQGGLMQPDAA